MHSVYARVNGISSLWSTCLMVLLAAVALSSFVFTAGARGRVEVVSLKVYNAKARHYPFKQEEIGFVKFKITAGKHVIQRNNDRTFNDEMIATGCMHAACVMAGMDADLRPLFNWNTKQLFVYLEAEYANAQGVNNTVVIWDRIVRRKEDANIVQASRNKYKLREVSESFRNVSRAEFSLKYNVMPYVGLLTYGEAARTAGHEMPEALDAVA